MKKIHSKGNTEDVLPLMFELGRAVRQACVAAGGLPLPLAHLETLRFVGDRKNPTMRDVAAYLRIAAPSATAIIEELADKGLLSRKPDSADRRLVRLFLSQKGKSLVAKHLKLRMQTLRSLVAPLSATDKRELARILLKLVKK